MEHPPKQGLKHRLRSQYGKAEVVLMEHPPKQGLKLGIPTQMNIQSEVLMEHPPKQGLKLKQTVAIATTTKCFNGTSTKTRIETLCSWVFVERKVNCFNGTSTKTRIETQKVDVCWTLTFVF